MKNKLNASVKFFLESRNGVMLFGSFLAFLLCAFAIALVARSRPCVCPVIETPSVIETVETERDWGLVVTDVRYESGMTIVTIRIENRGGEDDLPVNSLGIWATTADGQQLNPSLFPDLDTDTMNQRLNSTAVAPHGYVQGLAFYDGEHEIDTVSLTYHESGVESRIEGTYDEN